MVEGLWILEMRALVGCLGLLDVPCQPPLFAGHLSDGILPAGFSKRVFGWIRGW